MSADVATVVVAVLGAIGTLSSPMLTQWVASRSKSQDFELEARRRQEDRDEDGRRSMRQERRQVYAELNTAARQYEQAIYACLREMPDALPTPEQLARLTKARDSFRELYSDAQMMIPDTVLAAAMDVSAGLGEAYGTARRLEQHVSADGSIDSTREAIQVARAYVHEDVYRLIIGLRGLMRDDLGVSGPSSSPD